MNSTKTDDQVSRDVRAEIDWEPELVGSGVLVTTKHGVVTLSGTVDAYHKKQLAERAAQSVVGVRAVAEEIEVRLPSIRVKSDAELAEAALNALVWNTSVDEKRLRIVVENGVVRLEGTVEWRYQRDAAEATVRNLTGVRGIVNRIQVQTSGGKVVLTGNVRDWTERQEAERAAWAAPGVTAVEDLLAVV